MDRGYLDFGRLYSLNSALIHEQFSSSGHRVIAIRLDPEAMEVRHKLTSEEMQSGLSAFDKSATVFDPN